MADNNSRGETRTVFRPNFGNCAELPLYENWFSDMAAQGRHLLSWGTWFCRFAERNPKQTHYRIDLREKVPGVQRTAPAHEGWVFVCRRDDAFVFRADGEEPPPFTFDPRRRFASLQEQKKSVSVLALLLWALGVLTVLIGFLGFSWRGFLTGGFGYFLAGLVFAACAVCLTLESIHLQRIYYGYKTRQEERKPNWRVSRRRSYVAAAVCVTLFTASLVPLLIQGFSASAGTLPFQPAVTGAPLPWLEYIDGTMPRVPARNPGAQYNYDTNNFIAQKWSLLAPGQYSSRQCGESEQYHPVAESESITCLLRSAAIKLFEEYAIAPNGWTQVFAIDGGSQIDQLRLYSNEYGEFYLAARDGKTVLTVKYHGTAGQAKLLEAVDLAFQLSN
jgi:hypothetical protein